MSMLSTLVTNPVQCRMRRHGGWLLCSLLVLCAACAPVDRGQSSHLTETVEIVLDDDEIAEVVSEGDTDGRVLRHAVFFKFKDSSTDEQVRDVVDAFRALPSKIDTIVDFEWGINNSPEGLNDEFTHCFLLSFKDDAGRAVYLPHEAHKAFGNVLRPHMDKVFVIDYWGKEPEKKLDKKLRHMVFLKFKDDAAEEEVQAVIDGFAALPAKIDTIKAFEWGTNNSPETHDAGFTHAFMVTFDAEEGRQTYLPHPDHDAFVEVLKPVLDKVRVLDFWAQR